MKSYEPNHNCSATAKKYVMKDRKRTT